MLTVVRFAAFTVALTYCMTSLAGDFRQPLELAWFNSVKSQISALSQVPSECVKPLDDPRFSLGRLAFNSPRLLGGQAGRMGLSCASCHPSGRANNEFFIQQISDQPGKVDISHHFLSSQGGDKIFNPRPIPDLADIQNLRFKERNDAIFDELLVRLIEVEFDGQPATASVFDSLKLYLGLNDIQHCEAPGHVNRRTLATDWTLIEDGMIALAYSITLDDTEAIHFVSASMRSILETLYRFYAIQPNKALDKSLIAASRTLEGFASKRSDEARLRQVKKLVTLLGSLKAELVLSETVSFYNAELALEYLNRHD